jgi:hypothetical protein
LLNFLIFQKMVFALWGTSEFVPGERIWLQIFSCFFAIIECLQLVLHNCKRFCSERQCWCLVFLCSSRSDNTTHGILIGWH